MQDVIKSYMSKRSIRGGRETNRYECIKSTKKFTDMVSDSILHLSLDELPFGIIPKNSHNYLKTTKTFLPFPITYMCETAFSKLISTKTNTRTD